MVKEKKSRLLHRLGGLAVPAVLLLVYYLVRETPWARHISDRFSEPLRSLLSGITAKLPFSAAEVIYTLLALWAIYCIVRILLSLFSFSTRGLEQTLFRVLTLCIAALWLLAAYSWFWGIGYYGDGFEEKSGLEKQGYSTDELCELTQYFAQNAAKLSTQVKRDAAGAYDEDIEDCFDRSARIYENISAEFPFLDGQEISPKPMFYSRLMSSMGYTGFYFPFTGEANVNTDAPACLIPSTLAHELAHQRGIASEDEANFVGILACVSSRDTVFEYSGYLQGLIHLGNALNKVAPELWGNISRNFTSQLRTDINANREYWALYSGKLINKTADQVVDSYLKYNGQELGLESYGACVDLLLAYYNKGE